MRRARFVSLIAGLSLLALAGGCRSRGAASRAPQCAPEKTIAKVQPCDSLTGRLVGKSCQCFFFEGVEYSLLTVDFRTDAPAGGAVLSIVDPEGKPVDLAAGKAVDGCTCRGSDGIVLRKSGTYRGTVCHSACDAEHLYTFAYDLTLVEPVDETVHLTACKTHEVSFTASRGSRVIVTVTPKAHGGVVPKFVAVEGPGGTRALDAERAIQGAPPAAIEERHEGARVLDFNAPKSGRYSVRVAAEEKFEGVAVASVQIFPPKPRKMTLFHDNHPCAGVPVASAK